MAKVNLVDNKGKEQGHVDLADAVFGVEPNEHLLYLAVVRQNANARAGAAHSKTRAEVRGGGAKPWRQKGTGRARAGSSRSPIWVGGGVMHGPRNNVNWTKGMNKKERKLALSSALSKKLENTVAIKDFGVKNGQTKEFAATIDALKLADKTTLVIVDSENKDLELLKRSSNNLHRIKTITDKEINVNDLLKAESVVITEAAAKEIEKTLNFKAGAN